MNDILFIIENCFNFKLRLVRIQYFVLVIIYYYKYRFFKLQLKFFICDEWDSNLVGPHMHQNMCFRDDLSNVKILTKYSAYKGCQKNLSINTVFINLSLMSYLSLMTNMTARSIILLDSMKENTCIDYKSWFANIVLYC